MPSSYFDWWIQLKLIWEFAIFKYNLIYQDDVCDCSWIYSFRTCNSPQIFNCIENFNPGHIDAKIYLLSLEKV